MKMRRIIGNRFQDKRDVDAGLRNCPDLGSREPRAVLQQFCSISRFENLLANFYI